MFAEVTRDRALNAGNRCLWHAAELDKPRGVPQSTAFCQDRINASDAGSE